MGNDTAKSVRMIARSSAEVQTLLDDFLLNDLTKEPDIFKSKKSGSAYIRRILCLEAN